MHPSGDRHVSAYRLLHGWNPYLLLKSIGFFRPISQPEDPKAMVRGKGGNFGSNRIETQVFVVLKSVFIRLFRFDPRPIAFGFEYLPRILRAP
jgi:hypothetical protein